METQKNITTDNAASKHEIIYKEGIYSQEPLITMRDVLINTKECYGTIKSQTFSGNTRFLQVNISPSTRQELILSTGPNQPISFMHIQEGDAEVYLSDGTQRETLSKFQTTIVSGNDDTDIKLDIKPGTPCKLSIILISRSIDKTDKADMTVCANLAYKITKGDKDAVILHLNDYNLKTAWAVKELDDIEDEGIVKKLKMEGKIQIILGMEYQQFKNDLEGNKQIPCSLTNVEMAKVTKASELINKEPHNDFSIDSLCREVLLSAAKLQEGFKVLHNRTVTDYIRNVRLEEAERLLKNTDYNISEVVYSVGFLSRSYFSKIFKMKYSCSPKEYKNEFRVQVA